MANRFNTLIENFAAGEVSPTLRGRINLPVTTNGCRRLENFYSLAQGGIHRREGTKVIMQTLNSSTASSRLYPFVFSHGVMGLIEFSEGVYRVINIPGFSIGEVSFTDPSSGTDVSENTIQLSPWLNPDFQIGSSFWTLQVTESPPFDPGDIFYSGGGIHIELSAAGSGSSATIRQSAGPLDAGTYQIEVTGSLEGDVSAQLTFQEELTGGEEYDSSSIPLTSTLETHVVSLTLENDYSEVFLELGAGTTVGVGDGTIFIDSISMGTQSIPREHDWTAGGDPIYMQLSDGGYLLDYNEPPRRFVIEGSDFTFETFVATDGPYCDKIDKKYGGIGTQNPITTSKSGDPSSYAVDDEITITATNDLFVSTDVGRLIRIRPNDSSAWGNATITSVTNAKVVVATVNATMLKSTTTLEWRLGAWSGTTGYPRATAAYEQRKIFGGTKYNPQMIWGSYAGEPDNFAPDDGTANENITDRTAIAFNVATDLPEQIQWLYGRDSLLIGTDRNIHRMKAEEVDLLLSARNINCKPLTRTACSRFKPLEAGDSLIFPQLYRKQLMELYYNTNRGRHDTKDLLLIADHLTAENPIICGGYQEFPYGIFYFGQADGTLLAVTYKEDEGVLAWHRHILGGEFNGGPPVIESIAQTPGATQDTVWMVVKRTVDGQTVRTIETLSDVAEATSELGDAVYLDAHVRATVTADPDDGGALKFVATSYDLDSGFGTETTLPLFTHLEGETVDVILNGVHVGQDTIVDGEPVLYPATNLTAGDDIAIGLNYISVVETNTIESLNNLGRGPGYDTRVIETTIRLNGSLGGTIGYPGSDIQDPLNYLVEDELFTGDIVAKFPHGWEIDTRVMITQDKPLPLNISLLSFKMLTGSN